MSVALRFDANLSMLFGDLPPLERPAAAARAGFEAVELWWPFDRLVPTETEVRDLADAIRAAGQRLVLLNLAWGDRAAGDHGLLGVPGQQARFRDNLAAALDLASRTGCPTINALYGNVDDDTLAARSIVTAVENLAFGSTAAADVGIVLGVEAMNGVDLPRYGIQSIEAAVELVNRAKGETGADVGVIFDTYHAQRSGGDLITRIRRFAAHFVHVQVGDAPDRFRPGTGEIAFDRVLAALEATGYDGYVGLEYRPSPDREDTFCWLPMGLRRVQAALSDIASATTDPDPIPQAGAFDGYDDGSRAGTN